MLIVKRFRPSQLQDFYVYMSAFFQFFGNGGPPFGAPNQPIDVVCSGESGMLMGGVGLHQMADFAGVLVNHVAPASWFHWLWPD